MIFNVTFQNFMTRETTTWSNGSSLKMSGVSRNYLSIPIIVTIWYGSGPEVGEEIILEGPNLSQILSQLWNMRRLNPLQCHILHPKQRFPMIYLLKIKWHVKKKYSSSSTRSKVGKIWIWTMFETSWTL